MVERFDGTKARLDEVERGIKEKQAQKEKIELFLEELKRQEDVITEFDEDQWYSLVDFVTIFNKEDIRFTRVWDGDQSVNPLGRIRRGIYIHKNNRESFKFCVNRKN